MSNYSDELFENLVSTERHYLAAPVYITHEQVSIQVELKLSS